MTLTFTNPLNNNRVSLILYQNQSIGEIYYNNNFIITDTNISGYYYDKIKKELLPSLLFHYGIDSITLITKTIYKGYYKQLGFQVIDKLPNKQVKMIYRV